MQVQAFANFISAIIGGVIVAVVNWVISKRQLMNQLKLAVLEKRLSAHQNAFGRIARLRSDVYKENTEFKNIINNNWEWWYDNCLYLDKKCRESLPRACNAATSWYTLSKTVPNDTKNLMRLWGIVEKAVEDIERAIGLPPVALQEKPKEGESVTNK